MKVAAVRRLIEETALTYGQIAARRRRARQHLPLDGRRRLEAAAVCAARDRHDPARWGRFMRIGGPLLMLMGAAQLIGKAAF